MASPVSKSEPASRQQLFLLFRIGTDRYALDSSEIAEVLAQRRLKQLPGAPPWVAGVLTHRGQTLPVIDLALRTGRASAQHKTSTRLVLVHYQRRTVPEAPTLLGMILEQATDTLRCRASDFREYGLDNRDTPFLGPVLEHPQGLIQRITVHSLLPDDVHAVLFPAAGDAT
jgi:chemotaxis-related protein WspB